MHDRFFLGHSISDAWAGSILPLCIWRCRCTSGGRKKRLGLFHSGLRLCPHGCLLTSLFRGHHGSSASFLACNLVHKCSDFFLFCSFHTLTQALACSPLQMLSCCTLDVVVFITVVAIRRRVHFFTFCVSAEFFIIGVLCQFLSSYWNLEGTVEMSVECECSLMNLAQFTFLLGE